MTRTTTAYQCSAEGVFTGETLVQEDVFAPGTFLLPAGCTLQPPPAFDAAMQVPVFAHGGWRVETLPPLLEPEPVTSIELATEANRPEAGPNQIAVIVDGQWQLLTDWRGTTYWLDDGTKHTIVALGETLPADALLSPTAPPAPAPPTLDEAKADRIAMLRAGYATALRQPVRFTTQAGMTDAFATDTGSVANLDAVLAACAKTQDFPSGLWLNASGLPVTPFSYADLQGLVQAIANHPAPDYQDLLLKIRDVMAATTIGAVQAVTW
ncbi:hypothetical protein P3T23_009411 [Paraburkholderia sp. GAS448]|uniref:hypothetical protein n=1 Tax=Paraburkholderia sp. GAS448 TaxID=3035136 RepID=UPI003D23AF18